MSTKTPADLDGTATGPTFTIARVVDEQHVWLCDVERAPLVPKTYGKTDIVTTKIGFTFERPAPGADYVVTRIRVLGWRAKKDGTASELAAEESWRGDGYVRPDSRTGRYHDGSAVPLWLIDLANAHRPQVAGATHVYEPVHADNAAWRPPYER